MAKSNLNYYQTWQKNKKKIEKIRQKPLRLAPLSSDFKNLMPYNHQFV